LSGLLAAELAEVAGAAELDAEALLLVSGVLEELDVAGAAEFDGVAFVSGVLDVAGAAELEADALLSGVLEVAGAAEVAAADCEALAF
jgi:hypothetical protein